MAERARLDDLGARVSDGEPIDWAEERRRSADQDESRVVEQLVSIQRLAAAMRELPTDDVEGGGGDATITTAATPGSLKGAHVGPYVIEALVGRGGMGEVYRARDERLGRSVAMKVLSTELASDEVARRRFLRETRLACRVSHPYVAAVYDVLEEEGRVHLVMEWIRGQRLDKLMSDGRLPTDRAAAFASEIAEALRAVHHAELVHRDLKPGNVMVTPDGHVKIMDFGVALHLFRSDNMNLESVERLTADNRRVGTVSYMSPEQIRGEPIDARSDLFALGILLWEMLSGTHPFARPSGLETASAILKEPPGSGDAHALDCPAPLRRVVLKLLDKEPGQRYADADSVVRALRAASTGEAIEHGAASTRRGRAWPAIALTALGIAAAIGVAVLLDPWGDSGSGGGSGLPVVAVLPFSERDRDIGTSLRGEMTASLVGGGLFESGAVRPLDVERVLSVPAIALGSAAERAEGVAQATGASWVVVGELLEEGGTLIGTVRVYRAGTRDHVAVYTIEAGGTSGFAALAAARVLDVIEPGRGDDAARAVRSESRSEEARSAVYRARAELRRANYGSAISALESAVELDQGYVAAHTALAESLYRAGWAKRARTVAETAGRRAEAAGSSIPQRTALEAQLVRALVFERIDDERAASRGLIERYRDDPGLLVGHADVCARAGQYEEALGVVTQAEAIDSGDLRVPLARARVLVSLGRFDEAIAALDRADSMLGPAASPEVRARVAMQRGQLEMTRQAFAVAAEQYRRAEPLFNEAQLPTLAARARRGALEAEVVQGKFPETDAEYDPLLNTFRSAGALQDVVRLLNQVGGRHFLAGEFEKAEPLLRNALEAGRILDNPVLLLYPKLNLAALLNYVGRSAEGGGLATESLETAREFRVRDMEIQALLLLADGKLQQGHLQAAVGDYRDVIALARAPGGSSERLGYALLNEADIDELRGAVREGLVSADAAVAELREKNQRVELGYSLVIRSRLRSQAGDARGARDDLLEAESLAKGSSGALDDQQQRIALARAALALRQGAWAEARSGFEQVRASAAGSAAVSLEVPALVGLCRASLELGQSDAAETRCREAETHVRALRHEATEARVVLAEVFRRERRFSEAEGLARRAFEEAAAMDTPAIGFRAAATLVAIPGLADEREMRRRGADLLQAYLGRMPEASRERVEARPDLASAVGTLISDSR